MKFGFLPLFLRLLRARLFVFQWGVSSMMAQEWGYFSVSWRLVVFYLRDERDMLGDEE